MADNTRYQQGTEKVVTRYDKWLSYGGDYVEMQWDRRTIKRGTVIMRVENEGNKMFKL